MDGIPFGLALATVIAACPMLIAIVLGSYAIIAGAAANDASGRLYDSANSYQYSGTTADDPFGFTAADQRALGAGLGDVGDASVAAGWIMVGVGLLGLLAALAMAGGSKAGLFLTCLWMIGALIWMTVQLGNVEVSGDTWWAAAPMMAPPVIALVGLCSKRSQAVFREP